MGSNGKISEYLIPAAVSILAIGYVLGFTKIFPLTHTEFVAFISDLINNDDLISKIQQTISPNDFKHVKTASLLGLIGIGALLILSWLYRKSLTKAVINWLNYCKAQWFEFLISVKSLSTKEQFIFWAITALFLIKSYYFVYYWPMQYDEAWTFNYFIHPSWIVPLTAPHNNHVLYTLIAKGFYQSLFFLKPIVAIRFPLPLFALGSGFIIYALIEKFFSRKMALICFALFLALGPVVFYSLYARAYIVQVFFIMAWLYHYFIWQENQSKAALASAILSAILAFYAMPTTLYALLPLFILFLFYSIRRKQVKAYLAHCILIAIGTIVLYFPMLIATKFSWLVNGTKRSQNLKDVFSFEANKLGSFVTGIPVDQLGWIITAACFALITIALVYGKHKSKIQQQLLLTCFVSWIAVIAYLVIQKQILPPRLFSYLAIFSAISFSFLLYKLLRSTNKNLFAEVALALFLVFSYLSHQHSFFNWSTTIDRQSKKIAELLIENDKSEVYNFFYYAKPTLEYHSIVEKHDLNVIMPQQNSISYEKFNGNSQYQALVWDKDYKHEAPNFDSYKLIWSEDSLSLYFAKE